MASRRVSQKKKRGRRRGQSVLKERILQTLSITAQALDTFGDFTYHPYPYLYASLGTSYRKDSIDRAVRDLVKKGLVEGDKTRGLQLTPAGADVKKSLIRAREKKWDGQWRVVIFDIPEAQRGVRNALRFELKKLGFGLWQRSVWVSPFDVSTELNSYLRSQNLSGAVQILVGKRVGDLSDREFAAKIWPLEELNQEYASLLNHWKKELQRERSARQRFRAAAILHGRYLDILARDPQLPPELLPPDWAGAEAQKLFKKLTSFLTVTRPS